MLTVPDDAIPDLGDIPEEVPEAELPETPEESPLVKLVADVLGLAPAVFLQFAAGLEYDEFIEKKMLYTRMAYDTELAVHLAEYIEEYMPDWMDDPRIAILMSLLMFGMMVGADVRATLQEKKRKEKVVEEGPVPEITSEPVPGGEA